MDFTENEDSELYSWICGTEQKWKMFDESSVGSLVEKIEFERKRKYQKRPTNIRLRMMRYTLLFIDMTQAIKIIDLKPTRLDLIIKNSQYFVESYFDQNPISQLGICMVKSGLVEKLTDMAGNPKIHIDALATLKESLCDGEPSLENILHYSQSKLKHIPNYASREVIIVMASITTIDHDNIHDTIEMVRKHNIRCSVISLSTDVFVYKKLTKVTGGRYQVILDESDLKFCFQNIVLPPASSTESEASLIHMGFPSYKKYEKILKVCTCHDILQARDAALYTCPRCNAAFCDLPVECNVCGLMLVSAPHLARSYHHLFPLEIFSEIEPKNMFNDLKCSACSKNFKKPERVYQCSNCQMSFCVDCDDFLHASVHVCPNCSEKPMRNKC